MPDRIFVGKRGGNHPSCYTGFRHFSFVVLSTRITWYSITPPNLGFVLGHGASCSPRKLHDIGFPKHADSDPKQVARSYRGSYNTREINAWTTHTFSPSDEFMPWMVKSSAKSTVLIPSKHFRRCGCTRNGSWDAQRVRTKGVKGEIGARVSGK